MITVYLPEAMALGYFLASSSLRQVISSLPVGRQLVSLVRGLVGAEGLLPSPQAPT